MRGDKLTGQEQGRFIYECRCLVVFLIAENGHIIGVEQFIQCLAPLHAVLAHDVQHGEAFLVAGDICKSGRH